MFINTQTSGERHRIVRCLFHSEALLFASNSIKENPHCVRDWSLFPRIHSPLLFLLMIELTATHRQSWQSLRLPSCGSRGQLRPWDFLLPSRSQWVAWLCYLDSTPLQGDCLRPTSSLFPPVAWNTGGSAGVLPNTEHRLVWEQESLDNLSLDQPPTSGQWVRERFLFYLNHCSFCGLNCSLANIISVMQEHKSQFPKVSELIP